MHEKTVARRVGAGTIGLLLCLTVLAPMARAQETGAATPEDSATPAKRKVPATAWGLSFVYPGLGQAYNGDWGRAVAFGVPASIGWALYWSSWEDCVVNDTNCATRNVSAAIILAAWLGAQIDAPRRASAINRERSLLLEIGPTPSRLGMSLVSVRF